MSSTSTYEGVMSVPPPNHHCPGTPFHSSVSKYLEGGERGAGEGEGDHGGRQRSPGRCTLQAGR